MCGYSISDSWLAGDVLQVGMIPLGLGLPVCEPGSSWEEPLELLMLGAQAVLAQ